MVIPVFADMIEYDFVCWWRGIGVQLVAALFVNCHQSVTASDCILLPPIPNSAYIRSSCFTGTFPGSVVTYGPLKIIADQYAADVRHSTRRAKVFCGYDLDLRSRESPCAPALSSVFASTFLQSLRHAVDVIICYNCHSSGVAVAVWWYCWSWMGVASFQNSLCTIVCKCA